MARKCVVCSHDFEPKSQRDRKSRKTCLTCVMLKCQHGINLAIYDALLESQGGGCAICGIARCPSRKRFAVDHDHACCPGSKSCGKCVRGLLCFPCNQMVGLYENRLAVAYQDWPRLNQYLERA